MSGLYVDKVYVKGKFKSAQTKQVFPKVSRRELEKEGYTGITREQAYREIPKEGYWSKGKFTKYKGKAFKDQYGRTYFFRKQHIFPKSVQKTISKKTQALYPSLSQDQKWFKRVSKEWSKKKGRTPFDF